jgi:hypothetical protein
MAGPQPGLAIPAAPMTPSTSPERVPEAKPAFNVSVKGSFSILPYRLALTGTSVAPPGFAEDVRYGAENSVRVAADLSNNV